MDPGLINKLHVRRVGRAPPRLTTVAACEDASTESRIEDFYLGLTRQLGETCELEKQIWLLSQLRTPGLRAIAATEAATADLIIVAVHAADSLPPAIEHWIKLWLKERAEHPGTLLALFDPPYRGISAGMQNYLREVAQSAHIEFFAQSEETPGDL